MPNAQTCFIINELISDNKTGLLRLANTTEIEYPNSNVEFQHRTLTNFDVIQDFSKLSPIHLDWKLTMEPTLDHGAHFGALEYGHLILQESLHKDENINYSLLNHSIDPNFNF